MHLGHYGRFVCGPLCVRPRFPVGLCLIRRRQSRRPLGDHFCSHGACNLGAASCHAAVVRLLADNQWKRIWNLEFRIPSLLVVELQIHPILLDLTFAGLSLAWSNLGWSNLGNAAEQAAIAGRPAPRPIAWATKC